MTPRFCPGCGEKFLDPAMYRAHFVDCGERYIYELTRKIDRLLGMVSK